MFVYLCLIDINRVSGPLAPHGVYRLVAPYCTPRWKYVILLHLPFHNRLWVMGGQTAPGFAEAEEHFYDDIWASPNGIKWNKMVPQEPHWCSRGMIGGHVVFKDRIWILGGGKYDTPQTPDRAFYNDVWSSHDGIHWHCHIQHAPWTARQYHEVAVFDGRMWVLEGWNQSNRNDVWYSDPPKNTPLIDAPNVIMLPHLGASTKENLLRIGDIIESIIRDFVTTD